MDVEITSLKPLTTREKQLKERAEQDYAALNAIGLYTGETFYPPGTEAVAGISAIKRHRADFMESPLASDALESLVTTVQGESRSDIEATFGEGPEPQDYDGPSRRVGPAHKGLTLHGKHESINLVPTERAVTQLLTKRPAGHAATAWDVGNWIGDVEPHPVVLRTRALPGNRIGLGTDTSRELFAMVSRDYVPYDIDAAANDLLSVCPSDSRARIRYDGARARVDIILQNPYRLDGTDAAAVGETHRMVLRMKTADDGSAGYHLSLLAERVRCINLTLLHASKTLFRATHRSEDLRNLAQDALSKGGALMQAFSDKWGQAWHEVYADKYAGSIAGDEAIKRIVSMGKFRIAGRGTDATLQAVLDAWSEEPGDSKAHVHNALTRAAHMASVGWGSRWADDDAEVEASQLLYQKVSWLPEVVAEA